MKKSRSNMYSVSNCQVYPLGHVGEKISFNTVPICIKPGQRTTSKTLVQVSANRKFLFKGPYWTDRHGLVKLMLIDHWADLRRTVLFQGNSTKTQLLTILLLVNLYRSNSQRALSERQISRSVHWVHFYVIHRNYRIRIIRRIQERWSYSSKKFSKCVIFL